MNTKINYLLPIWLGNRRFGDPRTKEDKYFYLKTHVTAIARVPNSIDQLTIIVNVGQMIDMHELIGIVKQHASVELYAKTVVLARPNIGISYGAFADAYNAYANEQFTHYIVTEDDCIFIQPNFDKKLLQGIMFKPRCGMYCGRSDPNDMFGQHPNAFVGIISATAMKTIKMKRGYLPYHKGYNGAYPDNEMQGQVEWGRAFIESGYKMYDWFSSYSLPYWWRDMIIWHGNRALPPFTLPITAIDAWVPIEQGGEVKFSSNNSYIAEFR